MKPIHNGWKSLADDCITIALAAGMIGIALKFTTFFDRWVYFPSFPNIFDAMFLVIAVLYLVGGKKLHFMRSKDVTK